MDFTDFQREVETQLSEHDIEILVTLLKSLGSSNIKPLIKLATNKLFIASGTLEKAEHYPYSRHTTPICVPIWAKDEKEAKEKLAELYKDVKDCYTYYFNDIHFQQAL